MTLKDLAIDHDYYCSESNYYSNEAAQHYKTFKNFISEMGESDVDMNLVFRWDIKLLDDQTYTCDIFIMQQRKGRFMPFSIDLIEEDDVPAFIDYVKKHFNKLLSIWKPIEP
jgi:hypothetical protein